MYRPNLIHFWHCILLIRKLGPLKNKIGCSLLPIELVISDLNEDMKGYKICPLTATVVAGRFVLVDSLYGNSNGGGSIPY